MKRAPNIQKREALAARRLQAVRKVERLEAAAENERKLMRMRQGSVRFGLMLEELTKAFARLAEACASSPIRKAGES